MWARWPSPGHRWCQQDEQEFGQRDLLTDEFKQIKSWASCTIGNLGQAGDVENALFEYVRTFISDADHVANWNAGTPRAMTAMAHQIEVAETIDALIAPMRERRATWATGTMISSIFCVRAAAVNAVAENPSPWPKAADWAGSDLSGLVQEGLKPIPAFLGQNSIRLRHHEIEAMEAACGTAARRSVVQGERQGEGGTSTGPRQAVCPRPHSAIDRSWKHVLEWRLSPPTGCTTPRCRCEDGVWHRRHRRRPCMIVASDATVKGGIFSVDRQEL